MVSQKTLYLTEYHLSCSQLRFILLFFDAEKISKMFIIPAVTFRKIHISLVVSVYRVTMLAAYKYLRRIIVLFLVSHCISLQYLQYLQYSQSENQTLEYKPTRNLPELSDKK